MLLPPGHAVHQDLNTSFTNFEELLLNLRENRFSGYIRLSFWEYEGILILDSGRMIQAYINDNQNLILGAQAAEKILNKAREKDGTIDVHRLPSEVSSTLASVFGATLFDEANHLTASQMSDFLNKIQEAELTGYVDITLGSKKGFGTIYFLEGIPIEAVIMSNTGRLAGGEKLFSKILELSSLLTVSLRMYRSQNISHLREEDYFLFPDSKSPLLTYWQICVRIFEDLVNQVSRKNSFQQLWQISNIDVGQEYPCFSPMNKCFSYQDGRFTVFRILPINNFEQGIILSLHLVLAGIPYRRRKKIKPGKVLETFIGKLEGVDKKARLPDPVEVVHQIYQELL